MIGSTWASRGSALAFDEDNMPKKDKKKTAAHKERVAQKVGARYPLN
jgi:hypothetical protein